MGENHKENGDFTNLDFSQSINKTCLPTWLRNLQNIPKSERTSLKIYRKKDHKECYVTTNEQSQLVASDGKSMFVLAEEKWEVPASTLEILNKPIKPPATGLGKK